MSVIERANKHLRIEILEILLYLVFAMLVILFVFSGVGLIGKAFEESFKESLSINTYLGSYLVYIPLIIISLFLPIFSIAKLVLLKKGEHISELKNPRWYHFLSVGSFIYDPEDNGFLWWASEKLGFSGDKNLMRWSKSILRMVVIGILLFSAVGLLITAFPKQMAFLKISDIPQITLQQITPLSEVIFSAEPASWSETMTLIFSFCILMGINGYLCAKFKLGKLGFFLIGFIFICPIVGFEWLGWHLIHYSTSETSLLSTFLFGWLGSTLTLMFGIFIWFYLWHFINNSFTKLIEITTNKEDILFIGIILWVSLLVGYIALEIYLYTKKKKIGEDTYFQ